jgi:stage II sporulation protein AA (anti-sigma F factor antagonist)
VLVSGDVDAVSAGALHVALQAHRRGHGDLILDVAEVPFIDSAGLNVLVRLVKALDAEGRGLVIRNPTPLVRQALDIGGVGTFARLEP